MKTKSLLVSLFTTAALAAGVSRVPAQQAGFWTYKSPMPTPRQSLSVAQLNGQIYAIGGYNATNSNPELNCLEVYDPISNSWTEKAPKPTPGHGWSIGAINGLIYVAGSPDQENGHCEVYNPTNDSWTTKTPPPVPLHMAGHAVVDGKLYLIGGAAYGWYQSYTLVYDPATDSWQVKASTPNVGCNSCCAYNGKIYAMHAQQNGCYDSGMISVYDPVTDSWTSKNPQRTSLSYVCLEVVNGLIYSIGGGPGQCQPGGVTNLVEIYNPDTDTWTNGPSMLTPRYSFGTCAINNVLYSIGGTDGTNTLASMEALMPPLSINMYAGLTLCGQVGSTNEIDYCNDLSVSNWTPLTTFVLSNSPCLYIDTNSTWFSHRFYRTVPQ